VFFIAEKGKNRNNGEIVPQFLLEYQGDPERIFETKILQNFHNGLRFVTFCPRERRVEKRTVPKNPSDVRRCSRERASRENPTLSPMIMGARQK
jgi:hypothetical protein